MRLNTPEVFEAAERNTPKIDVEIAGNKLRHEIVDLLEGNDNVGIELGVARGIYSRRMIESGKFRLFFGVDVYGDMHDTREYKKALKHVGLDSNYKLLRMTFEEALDLFEDQYFDFIYIDGFAHTGEEGGQSLVDWYRKLKIGGMFAGDDYDENWPLVKWAVNDFAHKLDTTLQVTGGTEDAAFSSYPTWFLKKQAHIDIVPDKALVAIGQEEKERIHNLRMEQIRLKAEEKARKQQAQADAAAASSPTAGKAAPSKGRGTGKTGFMRKLADVFRKT